MSRRDRDDQEVRWSKPPQRREGAEEARRSGLIPTWGVVLIILGGVVSAIPFLVLLAQDRSSGLQEPNRDASKGPVLLADIELTVEKVEFGRVLMAGIPNKPVRSNKPALAIFLRLKNTSTTRIYNYRSWADGGWLASDRTATLRDTYENRYNRMGGILALPVGYTGQARMNPGAIVTDVLLFAEPLRNIEGLILTLPTAAFEQVEKGSFEVYIPASMVVWRD